MTTVSIVVPKVTFGAFSPNPLPEMVIAVP